MEVDVARAVTSYRLDSLLQRRAHRVAHEPPKKYKVSQKAPSRAVLRITEKVLACPQKYPQALSQSPRRKGGKYHTRPAHNPKKLGWGTH